MKMYDIAIVGTGIMGTFIARELSRYKLNTIMMDRESDIANGTTMANSAIIHGGYDAPANSLKGRLNVRGNKLYEGICKELDVHYKRIGSLVLAFEERELETLAKLLENGKKNGVEGLKLLTQEEVLEMEPHVSRKVIGALYAPTAGIISPYEMAIALAENAMDHGVALSLNTQVKDIEKTEQSYILETSKGKIEAEIIINCAGVFADELYAMVGKPHFNIRPRKGHYFVLDKGTASSIHHVLFQCPTDKGKGVLVTPTVHGNVLIGPDAEFSDDKEDLGTKEERLGYIRELAKKTWPTLPTHKIIRSFTGLRATSNTGDFIIEEAQDAKGFFNVAGMESPGLSAAPAVAEYMIDILREKGYELKDKSNFNPTRRPVPRFNEMTIKERQDLIERDPGFGRIICRCEMVTEGEIVDCIHRNGGATTVKGVKKRTRAGMGRCQGGFCSPRVVDILARELDLDKTEIMLDGEGSYILTGQTKT